MLLIGSRAFVSIFGEDALGRAPNDYDYLGTSESLEWAKKNAHSDVIFTHPNKIKFKWNGHNYEMEISNGQDSAADYLKYAEQKKLNGIADKHVLYSVKSSHIHSPAHFEKNIYDYHNLKRICKDNDILEEITKKRRKETNERLKLKTPSLMKSKEDFFDDKVERVFIHDQIHEIMAHRERPMYTYLQNKPGMITCDKELWDKLDYLSQLFCVEEEVCIISLERKIIPFLFGGKRFLNSETAFKWALKRVCTTLCSGWFRQFAIDNYFDILELYDEKYVIKFLKAFEDGRIKRISNT